MRKETKPKTFLVGFYVSSWMLSMQRFYCVYTACERQVSTQTPQQNTRLLSVVFVCLLIAIYIHITRAVDELTVFYYHILTNAQYSRPNDCIQYTCIAHTSFCPLSYLIKFYVAYTRFEYYKRNPLCQRVWRIFAPSSHIVAL